MEAKTASPPTRAAGRRCSEKTIPGASSVRRKEDPFLRCEYHTNHLAQQHRITHSPDNVTGATTDQEYHDLPSSEAKTTNAVDRLPPQTPNPWSENPSHNRSSTFHPPPKNIGTESEWKNNTMKFITHHMCPFAQKAWIGLELTQTVPYELREIPLYGPHGKPAWFRQLNPRGTVPTLVVLDDVDNEDTTVLTDSDDILNHLFGQKGSSTTTHDDDDDDGLTTTTLLMREFRYELINDKLLPAGKRAVLGEGPAADGELRAILREINEHRVICDWLDQQQHHHPDQQQQLSVAHCHAFPFLWRLDQEGLIHHDNDDDAASSSSSKHHQYGNIVQWLRLCERHPAVAKTIPRQGWWWWW